MFSSESPSVVIRPSDTTILHNTTILLTCFGYGIPTPDVTWSMGEETLSNDSQIAIYNNLILESGIQFARSILKLCSATVAHNGEYICRLSNAAGNSNTSFYLDVLGTCTYSTHNYIEQRGGKLSYFASCFFPLSSRILISHHLYVYALIIFSVPPQVTPESTSVGVSLEGFITLVCTVMAFPIPTYIWEKDNVPLTNGNITNSSLDTTTSQTTLSIASAQLSDAGVYLCAANNSGGYDYSTINLTILRKYASTSLCMCEKSSEHNC